MQIIDTHSHIYDDAFKNDLQEIINRAKKNGINKILMPNIDINTAELMHEVAQQYTNICFPMMGLHPTSITNHWQDDLNLLKTYLEKYSYIAIGEIGIDLYWDQTFKNQQIAAFKEQLIWAIEYNLPVVIHSRNALNECITCIETIGADKLRGVFHSFEGDTNDVQQILSLKNFKIGINGIVTFKNSNLSAILRNVELSNIIVETDAPYLSPVPYRGKRNEPAFIKLVVDKLANIYSISPPEVANITTNNANQLFRL